MKKVIVILLLLAASLAAQNTQWVGPNYQSNPVDCLLDFRLTANGRSVSYDNRATACTDWVLVYTTYGLSAGTLTLESAPDNNGVAGTWVTFPGTNSLAIQPNGVLAAHSFQPFLSVSLTSVSGTGYITGKILGYRPRTSETYSTPITVTIANGQSLSAAINLGRSTVLAIILPAAWDGTQISFQASADGTTFGNVFTNSGIEYLVSAAAGRYLQFNPVDLMGAKWIKVRSGTSATPTNQTADRSITVIIRPI